MPWLPAALLILYSLALILLMGYSLHRHVMVRLFFKNRRGRPTPAGTFSSLPRVTVQLPIFNEYYVAERLIRAVAELDYPRDLLEIQVLDDSTDETTELVRRCTADLRARGCDIVCLHRPDRTGYKAGALAAGLAAARGEFVAVFDADFVPPSDFLQRTILYFTDGRVGMVQARWGHINRDYSLLTRVQAIFLDGHFVMEHGARSRSGLFFNFNGTAGVWRRRAIEEAGGWQHDTLTEDLDLSYRAQLAGWRFVFVDDLVSPAEVPVEMNAWKAQQFRWAKGSVQTAKKLLPKLLKSSFPWPVKLEASVHLTANFSYLLMALVAVLIFPAVLSRQTFGWYRVLFVDLPLSFAATGAVSQFYIHSQREIYADWRTRLKYLPCVLALGMGISLNNTRAVVEALMGYQTEFRRTPKYQVVGCGDAWWNKRYSVRKNLISFLEVGTGFYFCWVIWFSIAHSIYFPVPFLMLFCFGFFYVGGMSLLQGRLVRFRSRPSTVETAAAD